MSCYGLMLADYRRYQEMTLKLEIALGKVAGDDELGRKLSTLKSGGPFCSQELKEEIEGMLAQRERGR